MTDSIHTIIRRAVNPADVCTDGRYTNPRTYGVYQLPYASASASRFHQGNHPVRLQELERKFGVCTLNFLFLSKEDAEVVASALNGREA
ncbi:MAG: hypothetical protein NTV58_19445 [Deltaproteobacteria bacterium]|nr:hypothetical protein [Deltaproteobacteria bacterium]